VVPETRQIEGLAAETLSGSPTGVLVRTPAGLPELTSACPATHAGWVDGWWFMDRKPFFIGIPVP
jgi:hypothetical protein